MTTYDLLNFSFLSNASAGFVDALLTQYQRDPASVPAEWAQFFGGMTDVASRVARASWGEAANGFYHDPDLDVPLPSAPKAAKAPGKAADGAAAPAAGEFTAEQVRQIAKDSVRALMLIRAYRAMGHLAADLDPLGLTPIGDHPELDYRTYGFTDADLDKRIYIDNVLGLNTPTLGQILATLKQTYCDRVGYEFLHVQDAHAKQWLQERIEGTRYHDVFSAAEKKQILENLTRAESFEKFLDRKYVGTKRFGLEGGESLIPALEESIRVSGQLGVREMAFGMAHRGRLNVLTNVLGKPFRAVFSEFQGNPAHPDDVQGSGDVKYHLGTSSDRDFGTYRVHLSLTANPSHLEAVNPVVLGKVRAKQAQRKDTEREEVVGVLLHGDAAFAGQGIVPETFGLSDLKGYRTGGTLHFVINNQIGFTTSPAYARSSPYCTDVAQMVKSPIFHANGDDPEAVVWVTRLACEYRARFKKDVVIDIICYRRHGHNESDEPAFTQPKMYKAIAAHPTTRTLYAKALEAEGTLTAGEGDQITARFVGQLEADFESSKTYKAQKADWLEGAWAGLERASGGDRKGNTAVSLDLLREVGARIVATSETFDANPKIRRQLDAKDKAIREGKDIDWATAEALAFGTLLAEGTPVRLSGQDVGRGTFSQRHVILYDQSNETPYIPLNNLWAEQATIEVIDSPLAEFSVLGFDYGYSLADPHTLVCWEAQFGDFVNGAQVIIDQFITSAESKWLRMAGLVMLLPHGFEGQGPEHSSARLERFLQACAEDNIQVANCSTPAQYFHILRRQMRRNFRKPLVMVTPKSLLRHKQCVSRLEDLGPNTSFHRVLPDATLKVEDNKVRRVVLCSGKVYYDLLQARDAAGIQDVALVRLEQFYPFPHKSLVTQLSRFPQAEVIWCQEEPENMGAWTFVDRRLEAVLTEVGGKSRRPVYAGRPEAASPATGMLSRHNQEQEKLVKEALGI
jgi:2-oxoglutarate dehydrogenase E1 component